jgi:calcineurin-like phosphoesterase family protein
MNQKKKRDWSRGVLSFCRQLAYFPMSQDHLNEVQSRFDKVNNVLILIIYRHAHWTQIASMFHESIGKIQAAADTGKTC